MRDAVRNAGDQSVAHAERAMPVRHAVRSPAFREHLQLVQLVGREPSISSILQDHMLRAGCAHPALAGQNRTAGTVKRIGKRDRPLRIRVFEAVCRGASLLLCAFQILPCGQFRCVDPILVGHLVGGHENVAQNGSRPVVVGVCFNRVRNAVLHDARVGPHAGLVTHAETPSSLVRVGTNLHLQTLA